MDISTENTIINPESYLPERVDFEPKYLLLLIAIILVLLILTFAL